MLCTFESILNSWSSFDFVSSLTQWCVARELSCFLSYFLSFNRIVSLEQDNFHILSFIQRHSRNVTKSRCIFLWFCATLLSHVWLQSQTTWSHDNFRLSHWKLCLSWVNAFILSLSEQCFKVFVLVIFNNIATIDTYVIAIQNRSSSMC